VKKNIFAGLAVLFLMTGCVSIGNQAIKNETQQTIQSKIVEGKTTKEQVRAALGEATSVSFTDSGNEIWTYTYTHSSPKAQDFIPIVNIFTQGSDQTTKQLIVMFDKNEVVSKYTMRTSQNEVHAGLFGGMN
jgi:outer membrane protein assembly factor BamE (lipoprotein component of BamABCDE complex)